MIATYPSILWTHQTTSTKYIGVPLYKRMKNKVVRIKASSTPDAQAKLEKK